MRRRTLGIVDAFGDEHIETEFIGHVPLIPLHCYYRRGEDEVIEIPLHTRSVLLGYLQFYSSFLAIGAAAIALGAFLGESPDPVGGGIFVILGAMLAYVWYMAVNKWSGVSREDELRRAALLEVTGIGAYPSMLPEPMVKKIFKRLERVWHQRWKEWNGLRSWRDTIQRGPDRETAFFLAALACYQECLDDSDDLAAKAWENVASLPEGCREPRHQVEPVYAPDEDSAPRTEEADEAKPDEAKPDEAKPDEAKPDEVSNKGKPKQKKTRKTGPKKRIRMVCPRCQEISRIPIEFKGKTGLCPKCRGAIRVPSMRAPKAA